MTNRFEIRVLLTAILFLVPITGGLVVHTLLQVEESKGFSNRVNGYVAPKKLGSDIAMANESLVTISCRDSLGSGFSFNFDESDLSKGFKFKSENTDANKSHIVTNAHVVEKCLDSNLKIIRADKTSHDARILIIDVENDLVLLVTKAAIPPLFGSYSSPVIGFWVMALGAPHSLAGSVTFGNIINRDAKLIFTTASLSPGNSGGPLIDNEGYVYGVNSGSKPVGQNFNISIGVNTFCEKLIICPSTRYWQEE
jgi:S1-C subfamily serine protease